jgi:hypothetical protein
MSLMAGAGIATNIAGTVLKGIDAENKRDEMKEIAETPGVDTGALTGQALQDMLRYLPQGSELASKIAQYKQANVNAQEEAALPGVGAARKTALAKIGGLFSDDATWLKGVQRRGAALGLSSGLMGSAAGQIGTLKLSDTEQMQRTQLGTGLLGSLISGMRIADSPGVQSFLGPNPSELINIRSGERTQKMNLLAARAGMPTQLSTYGDNLQSFGGAMLGGGLTGGGTGGAFGGGNAAASTKGGVNDIPYFNDWGNELGYS